MKRRSLVRGYHNYVTRQHSTGKICHPPRVHPNNGKVKCDRVKTFLGTKCVYKCNKGYGFVDSRLSVTECLDDMDNDAFGVWSHSTPICKRKYVVLS